MFKRILYLAFLIIFTLTSKDLFATHGAGLDITYECINQGSNSNDYKIIVKYYRDCSSSSTAANSFSLDYSSSCGSGSISLPQISGPIFITPLCPGSLFPCTNGNLVELEEYIYEAIVTLDHCSDWTISVCASGNRNNAISTILNPGNEDLCVDAEINNLNYCNTSPSFSEYPAPYICVNQTYCYNNGAIDVDGDSLVYSLITPSNGGTGISYVSGFSPSNPISGTTTFDESTGDLCMYDSLTEVSIVAMKITEYRNGIQIGSVTRDIQIIALNCSTTPPILTGFNGMPSNVTNSSLTDDSLHFCATGNDNINFFIGVDTTNADSSSNNKVMYWSGINGISSAVFNITNNNSNNPSGVFNWTPQYIDVVNSPYTFTVTVEDDACPVNNLFSYTYTISLSSSLDFNISINSINPSCIGANDGEINLIITGTVGNPVFDWSGPNNFISSDQSLDSLFAGTYQFSINDDGGCTVTDTIEIFDPPNINITAIIDSVTCFGLNDGAIDVTIFPNIPNLTYNWSGPNGFFNTNQNISLLYSGTYLLTVIDVTGCSFDFPIVIPPPNPFNILITVDSISCYGEDDGAIDLMIASNVGQLSYIWNGPNGYSSSDEDIDTLSSGIYEIIITDVNGCSFTDSIVLNNPNQITSLTTITSCESYIWNNNTYTNTGVHSYNTTAFNGCDSVARLDLIINNHTSYIDSVISCDQYSWNGINYTTSGSDTYTTVNALGCDSIVTLNITINTSSSFSESINVCNPYLWNGILYTESGIYTDTIMNVAGCDSVSILDIKITSYSLDAITPICNTEASTISLEIIDPTTNSYTVTINNIDSVYNYIIDSLGLLIPEGIPIQFYPATNTEYTLISVIDGNNCQSNPYESSIVIVNPLPEINMPLNEVCINEAPFLLNNAIPLGGSYFINNELVSLVYPSEFQEGDHILRYDYTDSVTNCSASEEGLFTVFPKPFADFYCDYYTVKQDTPITFFSTSLDYSSLIWRLIIPPNDTIIKEDSISFTYIYEDTGIYTVKLIALNEYNCTDTAFNNISILPSYIVYIPSGFSPNGDNMNDRFFPIGEGLKEYRIQIYNRWGERVFNEVNIPWLGVDSQDGLYTYLIEIVNLKDIRFYYKGHISLLR